MKRLLIKAIFVVSLMFQGELLFAQQPTIQSLSEQIAQAEEEIRRSEELLSKIKNDRNVTRNELKVIEAKIKSRQKLINSLRDQIKLIESDIAVKNKNVNSLEKELEKLKKEYADMVYAAYKNHKLNNSMAFLFAARDFNDATLRIEYMRRYNRQRELKALEIDSISCALSADIEELNAKRVELDKSKSKSDKELGTLKTDESNHKKSSDKLAAEEKKVANRIKQKEKEKQQAEQQLQKIIEEEARKAGARKLSPEEERRMMQLSAQFDQNQGKFPYPINGGVITDRFGMHTHPVHREIKINNKGVNIAGEKGAEVHAVFEGVVTRVVFIKGLNNCVMVQHGEYFTVYSNLSDVTVKANDKVSTNQVIGYLPRTDDNNDYFLHFELWKGTTYLNPERWFNK